MILAYLSATNCRSIPLERIEYALIDQGFHLDNALFTKLKRSLIYYLEYVQCQNLANPNRVNVRGAFSRRYTSITRMGSRCHAAGVKRISLACLG